MTIQTENFSTARLAFEAGDYNGALHHLQTHISSTGNLDEPVASLLGETLLRLDLPGEAGDFFEMAAEADESHAFRNHREAALAYFRADNTDKALLNAMKAFRRGSDPELTFVLISLLIKTNETQLVDQLKFRLLESDDPKHLDLALELIGADRWDARSLLLVQKLHRHRPDDTVIRNAMLTLAREFCDYDTLDAEEQRLPASEWVRPNLLMQETPHDNIHWCTDEAANRLALNALTIQPMQKELTGRRRHARPHGWGEKIRVGYLSSDFFPSHATMRLLGDVLRRHDKSRFEIILFCTTPARLVADPAKQAARASWGEIVDLTDLDDAAAAKQIRARNIDILVDLKGHTAHSRVSILNHGPAPVQLTWLGFPGTTIDIDLDYVIGDRFVLPDTSKPFYQEKFCRLPESYQPNDPTARVLPAAGSRAEWGLPEDRFIFASFNGSAKISRETVDLWARILQETPDSVLWVMCKTADMEANLRKRLQQRGIDPDRMIATAGVPYEEHIARLQIADLALDTFPCNGHTTTSDMLWAGLPVISKRGQHFASRVSESLLNAMGLPELVAQSDEDFVALGVALARDPKRLAALRAHLAEQRFRAPLFDAERFCRHLESAFETMANRARKGEAPDHFDVPALPTRDGAFKS